MPEPKATRAREILETCVHGLEKLKKDPIGQGWLFTWAGTISLLRTVGFVLENTSDEKIREAQGEWWDRINKTKPEPKIFFGFIRDVGAAIAIVLICGVGGWAVLTELSGAVVASGQLVVDSNVKKVQHPTGGVVGQIRVRNGDHVKAGDVVIRLDDTVTRANLAIVVKQLDELAARQARLEAERDDIEDMIFPECLFSRTDEPDVEKVVRSERKLFDLRKSARQGQKSQLREKLAQLGEEIVGLAGQADSKKREKEFVQRELGGIRDLWLKQFTTISRLMALERDAEKVDGERNQLISAAAQAKGKIAETELQIITDVLS